jgi:hypothetical protein
MYTGYITAFTTAACNTQHYHSNRHAVSAAHTAWRPHTHATRTDVLCGPAATHSRPPQTHREYSCLNQYTQTSNHTTKQLSQTLPPCGAQTARQVHSSCACNRAALTPPVSQCKPSSSNAQPALKPGCARLNKCETAVLCPLPRKTDSLHPHRMAACR